MLMKRMPSFEIMPNIFEIEEAKNNHIYIYIYSRICILWPMAAAICNIVPHGKKYHVIEVI